MRGACVAGGGAGQGRGLRPYLLMGRACWRTCYGRGRAMWAAGCAAYSPGPKVGRGGARRACAAAVCSRPRPARKNTATTPRTAATATTAGKAERQPGHLGRPHQDGVVMLVSLESGAQRALSAHSSSRSEQLGNYSKVLTGKIAPLADWLARAGVAAGCGRRSASAFSRCAPRRSSCEGGPKLWGRNEASLQQPPNPLPLLQRATSQTRLIRQKECSQPGRGGIADEDEVVGQGG